MHLDKILGKRKRIAAKCKRKINLNIYLIVFGKQGMFFAFFLEVKLTYHTIPHFK